jgi:tol-pal system protein YbgF
VPRARCRRRASPSRTAPCADAARRVGANACAQHRPAPTPQAIAPPSTLPSPAQAKPAPKASGNPDQEYAAALATYRAREHGQAVLDFVDFIAKYPKHPLAGNAQYWIGEAVLGASATTGRRSSSSKRCSSTGPRRRPDALLKIGLCHLRLNDVPRAQKAWQRVVNDYPKSEPAAMARSLLATHSSASR